MPTPQLGLTALSFLSPVVPSNLSTLSVDSTVIALSILTDLNTIAIDVSLAGNAVELTDFTVVGSQRKFTGSIPVSPSDVAETIQFTGRNYSSTVVPAHYLVTPTFQFALLTVQSHAGSTIGPPTGVSIYKGQSTCRVEWSLPTYTGFMGVRVQYSTDASGVNVPYTQYADLVTALTRSASVDVSTPVTTTQSTENTVLPGTSQTSTVVETSTVTTAIINFSSADIPQSLINTDTFYVQLTTVVQDAATNLIYESQASGPFLCGYMNLRKVNPSDFLALQKSSDIAARLITEITRRVPDLDLTARSEIRDLIINPVSLEIASMSDREWFSRVCRSISALAYIDNVSGNGISDTYDSSTYKQRIARAYGLSSTQVQSFIDRRFEILGESAGVDRGGATTAVASLTFYTYSRPTSPLSVPLGVVVSTTADTTGTASVSFVTRGSASIDPSSASSYYDPENEWWAVSVPAEAVVAGAAGNVGEGSINQVSGGATSGLSVTNQKAAVGGLDQQTNADYAAMIQNRQVAGKDSGSRRGYWETAMKVPGVQDVYVVAAGDTDMVRDWSPSMAKHTFGCVDLYVRGSSSSQQTTYLPFTLPASSTYGTLGTYLTATLTGTSPLRFSISGFNVVSPIYNVVEMVATSNGVSIWLGTQQAIVNNSTGVLYLNPTEQVYVVNTDGTTSPWLINGVAATNYQFLGQVQPTQATFYLMVQYQKGIGYTPTLQPVTAINSVTGPTTGTIDPSFTELVHTTDFLLTGGSNMAGDTVSVLGTTVRAQSKTLAITAATTLIDSNMQVGVDANGNPLNILSVRSPDLSTVYTFGTDYTIKATGRYRAYSLVIPTGSTIPVGSSSSVVVAYYQFLLQERVTFQTETLTLTGSAATALPHSGFIRNSWLPNAHGQTSLLLDGYANSSLAYTGLLGAGVAPASRYIKVTYNNGSTNVILIEGKDFTLTVDHSGNASLTRTIGGSIPSGQPLTVSYYTLEVFTILTEYPSYVQQVVTAVDAMKHAGADVLVKAMVASPVDVILNVVLDSATTPDAVDGRIRTQVDLVLSNSNHQSYQAALVQQVMQLSGLLNVELPLLKYAKADGSYDIGVVIPTGTSWLPLKTDSSFSTIPLPANSFISGDVLLPEPTMPSGGSSDAYVGFLYEGQAYRRAYSIADFQSSTTPSFYLIGTNDQISTALPLPSTYAGRILLVSPATVPNPAALPYRVTYQVFGAASASDITVASSEYLSPGSVVVNYVSE